MDEMTLNDYQKQAMTTAQYPVIGLAVVYPVLGLAGEAGELAGKVKKLFRDKGGVISDEDRQALLSECGDCLWYVAAVARELGFTLDQVAELNLSKLMSRNLRGKIKGDGDYR